MELIQWYYTLYQLPHSTIEYFFGVFRLIFSV